MPNPEKSQEIGMVGGQCKPSDGVACWPITSPKQCRIIMEHHSKENSDEGRFDEDPIELRRMTPVFHSDFRGRVDALLQRVRNTFDRGTMSKGLLTLGFVEAFAEALDAGGPSRSILGEHVEGIIYIQSTARSSEWAFAFVYMRGIILEWIRQGLFTLETAPRKMAMVRCNYYSSYLDVTLQCAMLTGNDLTIEYENEQRWSYRPKDTDDMMMKRDLKDICKRLLWLTPFDVISVPKEGPKIPFFRELAGLLAAPLPRDSSEDMDWDLGESDSDRVEIETVHRTEDGCTNQP